MTERDQVRLLFHGSIVLLVGLLSGVPMGQAITGGWGEEVVRAWRVAHVGLAAGGLMLIALAPAAGLLTLGPRGARWFVAAVLAAAYGAVVALPLGAIAGVRGLEPRGPALNIVVWLGNTVLALGSLFGTMLVMLGARTSLRTRA